MISFERVDWLVFVITTNLFIAVEIEIWIYLGHSQSLNGRGVISIMCKTDESQVVFDIDEVRDFGY